MNWSSYFTCTEEAMNYVVAIAALYSYSKGCAIQSMEATIVAVPMQLSRPALPLFVNHHLFDRRRDFVS